MDPLTSLDYSKYIGTPYEEMNCWEVAKTFYLEYYGIKLKHYYEVVPMERKEVSDLISTNIGDFFKVESPKFGDLVLAKLFGVECHIMVYVGEGKVLHTSKNTGCVVDRLSKWSKAITGFYSVKRS